MRDLQQLEATAAMLPEYLRPGELTLYADLLTTGDARCIETAKMIDEAYVVRLFTEA
jgi:hypothetical protein